MRRIGMAGLVALGLGTVLYAAASYPSSIKSFSTRVDGQTISASWFNEIHDEVVAIETGLLNGFTHALKPQSDATYDLGTSSVGWRDGWFTRDVTVGGDLDVTGTLTCGAGCGSTDASDLDTGNLAMARMPTTGEWACEGCLVSAGGGSGSFRLSGLVATDDTQAATGANTTETALYTYTLPANTFDVNGRTLRIRAMGTFAANSNNKTVRIRFGGTATTGTICATAPTSAFNGKTWMVETVVTRLGSGSQRCGGVSLVSDSYQLGTSGGTLATASATDTSTISVFVTGLNGSSNANDIVYEAAWVEVLN